MRPAQRPGSCSKAIPASPAREAPPPLVAPAKRAPGRQRERPPQRETRGAFGPAAPMRRRSCRGAGSTTAALALETLLAGRAHIRRTPHRAHRRALHHRTVETFTAPHETTRAEAAVAAI